MLKDINIWKNYKALDETLKKQLNELSAEELQDSFYTDLAFGTGGMRGILGPGTNRMNIYTIRRANYGYGKYILRNNNKEPKVVIAYDPRHNSLLFAKESARVLSTMGIKTYLFKKITPTPELSFAVRFLKADGGIVVTASHNPPTYNGYKIYDNCGCQLVPDLADIVIKEINLAPYSFDIEVKEYSDLVKEGLINEVDDTVDNEYLKNVKSISVKPDLNKDNFKVVFTPLHGTSAVLGKRLLDEVGYNNVVVKEQMIADPNFSTVSSPNPENASAFDLAIKYAKQANADICIATDPDADRVGLAVLHNNEYHLLTGNQTGPILIDYLAKFRKYKNAVLFNTIVTSSLGEVIAKNYGIDVVSTLTGFKFIGEQAHLLEGTDKQFFFGYEESYGYVVKDFVRDKDSLQALLLCSEVACYYKSIGKSLIDVLNDLYNKYGYYKDELVNIVLTGEDGALRIEKILNTFRENKAMNLNGLKVRMKEDYLLQIRSDNTKLTLPKSNVIKYFLDDGSWFVLRPSGTEPKMKIYISAVSKNKEEAENRVKEIKSSILKMIDEI